MNDLSIKIYRFLLDKDRPVKAFELATHLGFDGPNRERKLQSHGESGGILEDARKQIFEEHRIFLVTNFSGSILTYDIEKARQWIAPFWKRNQHAFDIMLNYKNRFEQAEGIKKEEGQLSLL